MPTTASNHAGALLASFTVAAALTACSSTAASPESVAPHASSPASVGPEVPATTRPEPTNAAPTPSETQLAADFIRDIDPAGLSWTWFADHSQSLPISVTTPDENGRVFTVGDPVYSDANADGLEDMAAPVTLTDGNGYFQHWYIWLATADGTATQVAPPITATARCGDATESVTAVDGGFEVKELLREPIIDDHLPCASPGTFAVTRSVAVGSTGDLHYPVDLRDPRGYGGVCPTLPRTETGVTKVWGSPSSNLKVPLSIDGEAMYLIKPHPHPLTAGAEPLVLAAVWPQGGHSDQRLCVWIDPVRGEGVDD